MLTAVTIGLKLQVQEGLNLRLSFTQERWKVFPRFDCLLLEWQRISSKGPCGTRPGSTSATEQIPSHRMQMIGLDCSESIIPTSSSLLHMAFTQGDSKRSCFPGTRVLYPHCLWSIYVVGPRDKFCTVEFPVASQEEERRTGY